MYKVTESISPIEDAANYEVVEQLHPRSSARNLLQYNFLDNAVGYKVTTKHYPTKFIVETLWKSKEDYIRFHTNTETIFKKLYGNGFWETYTNENMFDYEHIAEDGSNGGWVGI